MIFLSRGMVWADDLIPMVKVGLYGRSQGSKDVDGNVTAVDCNNGNVAIQESRRKLGTYSTYREMII